MIQTKVTRKLALAGFGPASKLSHSYRGLLPMLALCITTAAGRCRYRDLISRMCLQAATLALAVAGVLMPAVVATRTAEGQTFKILYTFTGSVDGNDPQAVRLIADKSGDLYGTAVQGGASGNGVVFKLDQTGNETVLYSFTGGTDGASPFAGLVKDASGNLYGTTAFGGLHPGSQGFGVVFKLDPAGNETVLHTFNYADGANPYDPVILDAAGNLYGTTFSGGYYGDGTVFKLDTAGNETVLHSFSGHTDGANPYSGLIGDSAGNLYGTTEYGGDLSGCSRKGCGVVFKLSPAGKGTVLYVFTGGSDGANPRAPVIRDAAGNLYGTTWAGGLLPENNGTVFKLDTAGSETVLYTFPGGAALEGVNPWAGLTMDSAGNLYGTTNHAGGACFCGTVFELDTAGKYTVLHTFDGSDGQYPEAPVILLKGALYGITSSGGPNSGAGTIFKVTVP